MSNCFKWIEISRKLLGPLCSSDDIDYMVEHGDLGSALDSYYQGKGDAYGWSDNGQDTDQESTRKLKQVFKIVAGEDRLINWIELKEILDLAFLKEMQWNGLSESVCRSMIALVDADRSGKIGVRNFIHLWENIHQWKQAFLRYSGNNGGKLNRSQLNDALCKCELEVTDSLVDYLVIRYGDKERQVDFDDFLACTTKIKCMTDLFTENKEDDDTVTISLAEFVENTLYT